MPRHRDELIEESNALLSTDRIGMIGGWKYFE